MKATQLLQNLGQSLWLDNITHDLLDRGILRRYIKRDSVTGLTSNPTIFEHAVRSSSAYNSTIQEKARLGKSGEEIVFDLLLEDIVRAADLFRDTFNLTNTVDGWVSVEVSPLLAYDTERTIRAAHDLFYRANRPNLLIKIPGTKEGISAVEETIFAGIPVNVTLLFSREQYLAAAEAFHRAITRRLEAGLNPDVGSVASIFVSRWDAAVAAKVPPNLHNQLGLAIARRTYRAARSLLTSPEWQRIYNAGARPQRLVWASTSVKDPTAPELFYVRELAAPFTVNTMPERTLRQLAKYHRIGAILPPDGGDCERVLAQFTEAGIDLEAVATQLQTEGARAFVKSWEDLMAIIASKSGALQSACRV